MELLEETTEFHTVSWHMAAAEHSVEMSLEKLG
jgi:hypothetical protein